MPECIGVFRAREAGEATAAAFERLGLKVALAPVIALVAKETAPPDRAFALVVGSSAPAFAFAGPWLARFAATPLALVGAATLRAAQARGLHGRAEVFLDAAALAQEVARLPAGETLYLTARERKSLIEEAFAGAGRVITPLETYEAQARAGWSEQEIAALGACRTFVHYSRRSASLALALARAHGVFGLFAQADHVCLSEDVAAPLRAQGWRAIRVAAAPDERALEAALIKR